LRRLRVWKMPSLEKMCSSAQYTVSAPDWSRCTSVRARMLDREVVPHEFEQGGSDILL
jgi:hypothetical protein